MKPFLFSGRGIVISINGVEYTKKELLLMLLGLTNYKRLREAEEEERKEKARNEQ